MHDVVVNDCDRRLSRVVLPYADCRAGNRPYWYAWTFIWFTINHSTVLETKLRLEIGLYDLMSTGLKEGSLILGRMTICLCESRNKTYVKDAFAKDMLIGASTSHIT